MEFDVWEDGMQGSGNYPNLGRAGTQCKPMHCVGFTCTCLTISDDGRIIALIYIWIWINLQSGIYWKFCCCLVHLLLGTFLFINEVKWELVESIVGWILEVILQLIIWNLFNGMVLKNANYVVIGRDLYLRMYFKLITVEVNLPSLISRAMGGLTLNTTLKFSFVDDSLLCLLEYLLLIMS